MTVIGCGADRRRAVNFFARCSAALCILLAPFAHATESQACLGTYRLSDGGIVDIARSYGDTLRWRRFDGTTGALTKQSNGLWTSTLGWTERPDSKTVRMSDCAAGRVTFDGMKGQRLAFDATDTTFTSHGTTLSGRLLLPEGTAAVPIVVRSRWRYIRRRNMG
jgi:hypothetical protein